VISIFCSGAAVVAAGVGASVLAGAVVALSVAAGVCGALAHATRPKIIAKLNNRTRAFLIDFIFNILLSSYYYYTTS
jgi:hypothetical protein